MAGKRPANKTGQGKDRKAHWQQPWVECVLQGTYSNFEKLLFMLVTRFGKDGCWMVNETIMEELKCSDRYVQQALTRLWRGGELIITGWNGHGRKIYAARNPEVLAAMNVRYEEARRKGKVKDKNDYQRYERFRCQATPNHSAGNPEP